jgi:hypothetical protein
MDRPVTGTATERKQERNLNMYCKAILLFYELLREQGRRKPSTKPSEWSQPPPLDDIVVFNTAVNIIKLIIDNPYFRSKGDQSLTKTALDNLYKNLPPGVRIEIDGLLSPALYIPSLNENPNVSKTTQEEIQPVVEAIEKVPADPIQWSDYPIPTMDQRIISFARNTIHNFIHGLRKLPQRIVAAPIHGAIRAAQGIGPALYQAYNYSPRTRRQNRRANPNLRTLPNLALAQNLQAKTNVNARIDRRLQNSVVPQFLRNFFRRLGGVVNRVRLRYTLPDVERSPWEEFRSDIEPITKGFRRLGNISNPFIKRKGSHSSFISLDDIFRRKSSSSSDSSDMSSIHSTDDEDLKKLKQTTKEYKLLQKARKQKKKQEKIEKKEREKQAKQAKKSKIFP